MSVSMLRAKSLLLASVLPWMVACSDSSTASGPAASISLDVEGSSLESAAVFRGDTVSIRLRTDTNASTRFWFSFLVNDGASRELTFRLEEALVVASPATWSVKQPVVSHDNGATWTRITDTEVQGSEFVFRHTPTSNSIWIALALPYNLSRWASYVDALRGTAWVEGVDLIGQTIDGNPIERLRITDPSVAPEHKTGIWVVARQHPGEPEGSFMQEGFLNWLTGPDEQAAELRRRAEVHLVGFMNPDGVLAGNQRVNRAGLDVNRTWRDPNPATSPVVAATQDAIHGYVDQGGSIEILIDFHAAPGARSNFFFYNEEATSSPEHHAEIIQVIEAAHRINPDFIDLAGSSARQVPEGERGRNWAFHDLQTHGLTVEATSNDVTYGPFNGQHTTEARLFGLGEAVGRAVAEVLYGVVGSTP